MNNKDNNIFFNFVIKFFLCLIIFLGLAILCKSDSYYKNKIYNYIYESNFNFSVFKNFYNKYLGGLFTLKNNNEIDSNESYVFNEKISYKEISNYQDGVKLKVAKNYLIPNLNKGIVVYVGDKEKYGSVVMVENDDGIDIWYGNVCNVALKLYDNIGTDSYIGESCDDYIYLVFSKNNNFLDYKDYIG